MTLSTYSNGQIDKRSLNLPCSGPKIKVPFLLHHAGLTRRAIWWYWGHATVSGVLHSPLSSFPSTLRVTSQKGGLRVTAWLLNTSISPSPSTFRLSEAVSLESRHDFPVSSQCFPAGKKAPDGLGCETNRSCQGTLTE